MKLIITDIKLQHTPQYFLKRAGYRPIFDYLTKKESFVRPLHNGHYPRFHIYIEKYESQIIFKLHLDQKQPSYSGAPAHSAEYDSPVVEEEIARLKSLTPKH